MIRELSVGSGGECFTWGNAVGGRLGLGSCLTDGAREPGTVVRVVWCTQVAP